MCFKYESLLCFISLGSILISSVCYNKYIINWLIFKQQILTSPSSGGWEAHIKVPVDQVSREGMLPGLQMAAFSLHPLVAKSRGKQASSCDLHMGTLPSCPNHLPKTLPPNTITLGGRISTRTFGRTQTFSLGHVASCKQRLK